MAYKRQALAAHPDKGGCAEAFHAVTRAFETLYDAAARTRYDSRLARARRPAGAQPERGRLSGISKDTVFTFLRIMLRSFERFTV